MAGTAKRKTAVILTSVFVVITAALVGILFFSPRFGGFREKLFKKTTVADPYIKVTYFYVGQGDAALVRDLRPGGKVMLIDSGSSREVAEFMSDGRLTVESAETRIVPYLRSEGIEKINYMVGTHKHGDHIGGFPYIIKNFTPDIYYDNGTGYATPYSKNLLKALKEKPEVEFRTAKAGEEISFGEDIICQFLAPLRVYENTGSDENNSSIVIRLTAGDISFLFTGDIEIYAELDIMGYGEDIKTTVMTVPHHGSTSSSSRPFLDLVMPETAIVSCGRYNPYGLPSFEIIRRYEDRGAKVVRTDFKGDIEILSDGINYKIVTER